MRAIIEVVVVFAPLVAATAIGARWEGYALGSLAPAAAATLLSLWLATKALKDRGRSWSSLGLVPPRRRGLFVLWCAATLVVTALIAGILRNVFVFAHVDAATGPFHGALRGRPGMLVPGLAAVWLVSAFGEELLFRGYLMDRILCALPERDGAVQGTVVLCAVLYALLHLPRGGPAVVMSAALGLGYGAMYFGSGRSLWVTVVAHGVLDTLALLSGASAAPAGNG